MNRFDNQPIYALKNKHKKVSCSVLLMGYFTLFRSSLKLWTLFTIVGAYVLCYKIWKINFYPIEALKLSLAARTKSTFMYMKHKP